MPPPHHLPRIHLQAEVGWHMVGLGVLAMLAHELPEARAHWGSGHLVLEGVPDLAGRLLHHARQGTWPASLSRSNHPLLARWGRREPDTWMGYARSALRSLPEDELVEQLQWLLTGDLQSGPIRIRPGPPQWHGARLDQSSRCRYGQGTLWPRSVPCPGVHHPGAVLSPWQAVLAWEARGLLDSAETPGDMESYPWRSQTSASPFHALALPLWRHAMPLRALRSLFSGCRTLRGAHWSHALVHGRRRRAGAKWDLHFAWHLLRTTPQGGFTAEAWPLLSLGFPDLPWTPRLAATLIPATLSP